MCFGTFVQLTEGLDMSQHPEHRSEKTSGKSKSNKGGNSTSSSGGHGNARESGKKGGTTTHGRN